MIVQYPDSCLDTPTCFVNEFDDYLIDVCHKMHAAMREHKGIGIAANQIGVGIRVAIISAAGFREFIIVNPIIVKSKGVTTRAEGCLSAPGKYVNVERAATVWLSYQNLLGARKTLKANDMLARVIQHEIDHLNGVMCLHRSAECDTH